MLPYSIVMSIEPVKAFCHATLSTRCKMLYFSHRVTIQVSLLLHRLRRQGGGGRRGHPAPRQGALQAPWDSLLNQGCCKIGKRRVLVGVQRATALCRSARGPRFILPARLRRRQQGSLQQPCLLNRYRL